SLRRRRSAGRNHAQGPPLLRGVLLLSGSSPERPTEHGGGALQPGAGAGPQSEFRAGREGPGGTPVRLKAVRTAGTLSMRNRTKSIIVLIAIAQFGLIIGLLALPTVVNAIPGRYRVWLQENHAFLSNVTEGVIDQVAPVATALPAPQ